MRSASAKLPHQFGAIALLLTGATGCTLSQAGRDRCSSDSDCNAGRVCVTGTCVAPGSGGTCGTGGGMSDARDTGEGPCGPSQPFGEPKLVPGLNALAGMNTAARFSPDERTAYWGVFNGPGEDLATASRGSISEPFGPMSRLDALNTSYRETNPFVTEDGLSLYFDSDRPPVGVYASTRMRTSDAFGAPQLVTDLSANNGGGVYFPSGNDVVYFHSAMALPNVNLYKGEHGDAGFTVTPLAVNSTLNEFSPVLPADELSVYFTIGRPRQASEPPNWDIFVATRSSRDADFGPPVAVDSVNLSGVDEAPSWISPDGCHLYFTRNDPASGNWIYVAEKTH